MASILNHILCWLKPLTPDIEVNTATKVHKKRLGKKAASVKQPQPSEVLPIDKMTKVDFEAALIDANWSIEAYRSELDMTDVMSERYTELLELIEIAENDRDNILENIELLSGNGNKKSV